MTAPRDLDPDEITAKADSDRALAGPHARSVRAFLFGVSTEQGPRLLSFQAGNLLLGRLPDNHLSVNHGSVSRRHARISVGSKGVTIEDMGSQNGTTVNGTPVHGIHPLRPGDIVRLGHVPIFYFGFYDPEDPPRPERVDHSLSITPSQAATG